MATYTENYDLKKPGKDDFYNIDDFNGNMDIIDNALAETSEINEKIGNPEDAETDTVFGKLNKGNSPVKSIQTVDFEMTFDSKTHTKTLDTVVDPKKCFVSMMRLRDRSGLYGRINFTLEATAIHVTPTYGSETSELALRFQIIELN